MMRFIPNTFTIGNLFCGFLALHYVFQGNYVPAAWLIFLGAVLDKMDGKLARRIGTDSQFGIQFDSIVDVCTFGMVPAVLIYQAHLQTSWGLALAFVFVLCGAIRLARFNTLSLEDERGQFYMGLTIPTAAICLTQYAVFANAWQSPHATPLAALLVLGLALLMISRLDYDSMPNFRGTSFGDRWKQVYFATTIGLTVYDGIYFFPMCLVYIFSGVIRWVIGLFSDEVTQHA
ncbi:MAG: CDP-diacylglycerol--serine O-phosphatidyltransferase [Candidatus Latescibacterota bacterium]|nr:CDP-diacylglycerol--serine O-phosphatidyltransferase [Candidatus Latescibacterota bacterium]